MGHLYDVRDKAISHEVAKGDTLATIATKYKGKDDVPADLDWKEIALYNWATVAEAEVVRALCERVGSSVPGATISGAAPADLALDPAFGPSSPEAILVPKLWKPTGLAVQKQHKIEVRRRTPASAIGITKLDKWFIPDHETCDVDYAAVGEPAHADTVDLQVYASNYGKLKDWKDGLPEFEPLPGVPVYAAEAKGGKVRDWKGLSKCDQGALAPDGHPLNVAFSPYTVVLRYAKKGTHGDARITLAPLWVTFDADGKPVPASCKIAWTIENAAMKLGLVLIADRTGAIVFAKGLNEGDLGTGSYEWDGKDATGALVKADGMPYRVQIQAHTGIDTEDGLALAAMHTEVRLYVHATTHAVDAKPYDPTTDQVSLDLSIADVFPKDAPPERSEGKLWTKHMLADAGFHPGPVNDAVVNDWFTSALHEFQRSVPKGGGGGGGPFERLAIGDDDDDTKDALAGLEARRKRNWFGKPAEPGDTVDLGWRPGNWTDTKAVDFLARLRDPTKRMIVWVDDRNWYTDGEYWEFGFYDTTVTVTPANLKKIHDAPEDLGGASKTDGRGSFEHRDDRVGYDARDVARPWIPFQVDFRLLGKAQELDAVVDAHPPELAAKVRAAIGPLRVDWTFDEIEKTATVAGVKENGVAVTHELPVLDRETDMLLSHIYHPSGARPKYGRPEGSRTRMALRWTLDKLKAEHDRKDVERKSLYFNAPVGHAGIRPDDPNQYFKAALGHGTESLAPWTAAPDDTRQSIVTAVHDRVGQEEAKAFGKRVGRAGIYFHPSRIAGDGYQVRAQVRFDAAGPYVSPNAAVLAARYQKLPQAHTVQLRLWRKTSLRGVVQWAPAEHWTSVVDSGGTYLPKTGPDQWRSYYTACHVSIENELGVADNSLLVGAKSLFADDNEYFALVKDTIDGVDPRKDSSWMARSDDYAWPWTNHPSYGVAPSFNSDFNAAVGELFGKINCSHVTTAIRMSLAFVKAIEAKTGRMRGHVLVQYQTTENCHFHQYRCPVCRKKPLYVQNDPSGIMATKPCPTPACTGTLASLGVYYSHVNTSGTKSIPGLPSPSCGFPLGVFWNFAGDASLWAHEIGHNRHYEHSADAPVNPDGKARDYHDSATNPFITHADEKAENKGWDRACLMSYVSDVADTKSSPTYDGERDLPCFCFKCVLKNRGWKLDAVPMPKGDLQDTAGVSP